MTTGTVTAVSATPPWTGPGAPTPTPPSIVLADGTSVPVNDPSQAAALRGGDQVSLGALVPAEAIATLSADDAATLATQPVVNGVIQVPASTGLGIRLLAATLAISPTPDLVQVTVTNRPDEPPLAPPNPTGEGSTWGAVPAAALSQTIDLVIAFPGSDATPWLTDAQALQFIADAQAWYRANSGLSTFTFNVSAVKHLTYSTGWCGDVNGAYAEWNAGAKLFGRADYSYYGASSTVATHLIVFEDQTQCINPTFGGVGLVGGSPPSLTESGYTLNRLVLSDRAYTIQDIVHELGHNFGLWHSQRLACTSASGTSTWNMGDAASCSPILDQSMSVVPTATAYGDAFEFMGFGYIPDAMGATRKYQLGLLAPSAVATLQTPGTQSVTLTAVPTSDDTTPQLAYIADSIPGSGTKDPVESSYIAGTPYLVELRHYSDPTGKYGSWMTGYSAGYGFVVLRANTGVTYLYQPTGTYATSYSAYTLGAGATFTSPDGLISIKVTSVPAASCTSNCTGTISVTRGGLATAIGTVSITGTAQVGKALTASATGVTPAGATVAFTWYRGTTAIGTGGTYTLQPADVYGTITVVAQASASGYSPVQKTSAAIGPVTPGVMTAPVPTITGVAQVGSTLTAVPGAWVPSNAVLVYDWFVGGVQVTDGSGGTYVPAVADIGKTVTVQVRGAATGYSSVTSARSAPTAAVTQLVTSVVVSPAPTSVVLNGTMTLIATVSPSTAPNKGVVWSSSDSTVASVSPTGVVTGRALGTATITATATDGSGKSGTSVVTVVLTPLVVTAVSVSPATASLAVGSTTTLTANVTPPNATNKVMAWSSSNSMVATVDANGVVTGNGAGSATITARATDGSGMSGSASVTVTVAVVTGISINPSAPSLVVGGMTTLSAIVTPSNASNKTVTWASSNTSVATVSATGVVTGKAQGTATITATATDGSGKKGTATATVYPVLVTGVSVSPSAASLAVGGTTTLSVSVSPSNATNKAVTWASWNPGVASVDGSGRVTAKAPGTVTITATAADGSGKTGQATVTVSPVLVSSVTIAPASASVAVGATTTLNASVLPSNASNKGVTWASLNSGVATVDSSGRVTGQAMGTATITATASDGSGKSGAATVTVTAAVPGESGVPMYRLYNPVTGEHFFTASLYEATVNVASGAWASEGIGWYAPPMGTGDPVYRLGAKPDGGASGHLYTTNAVEKQLAMDSGQWNDEGIGWYSAGSVSIFREYNPDTGEHNYTSDRYEIWVITSQQGWVEELGGGAAWMGQAPGNPGDQTVIQAVNSR